jgi:hypothetical protein
MEIKNFRNNENIEPDDNNLGYDALIEKAEYYSSEGDFDRAISLYKKAGELEPDEPFPKFRQALYLSNYYGDIGREEAHKILDSLISEYEYLSGKDKADAQYISEMLLDFYYLKAFILYNSGDLNNSQQFFLMAVDKDKNIEYPDALFYLALINYHLLEYKTAYSFVAIYEKVIQQTQDIDNDIQQDLYKLKGDILLELRDYEKAEKAFLKSNDFAAGTELSDFNSYYSLAWIKFLSDDFKNSLEYLKQYEEKFMAFADNDNFEIPLKILNAKLVNFYNLKNFEEMEKLISLALEEIFDIQNIYNKEADVLANTVFDILIEKEDYNTAQKVLDQRKNLHSFYGDEIDFNFVLQEAFVELNQAIVYLKTNNPKALETFINTKNQFEKVYNFSKENFALEISSFEEYWKTDIFSIPFDEFEETDFRLNNIIPPKTSIADFIDDIIKALEKNA